MIFVFIFGSSLAPRVNKVQGLKIHLVHSSSENITVAVLRVNLDFPNWKGKQINRNLKKKTHNVTSWLIKGHEAEMIWMNDFLQVPVWTDTYSLLLPLSISMTVQLADLDIVTNCYKPTVSLGIWHHGSCAVGVITVRHFGALKGNFFFFYRKQDS